MYWFRLIDVVYSIKSYIVDISLYEYRSEVERSRSRDEFSAPTEYDLHDYERSRFYIDFLQFLDFHVAAPVM